MRSALRLLSTLLIVSGSLLLADAGATLVWEEPVSSLYARFQQSDLQGQLDRLDRVKPTPVEEKALKKLPDPKRRLAFAARSLDRKTHDGDAVGKILIDRIGLSLGGRRGHGRGRSAQGPGPLSGHAAARPARHGRRSPGTARPTARRFARSTRSSPATRSPS